MSKEKQKSASVLVGAITVVAVFIMLGVLSQSWMSRLTLATIDVNGMRLVSAADVLARCGAKVGDNYETIDLEKVRARVARHPFVKKVDVRRALKESIVIRVTERSPVAAITIGDSLFFVDEEMALLPPSYSHEALDLPIVTACSEHGKIDSVKLRGAVALLGALAAENKILSGMISEITYREEIGYVAFSAEGGVPIRFGEKDFSTRAKILITWLEQYAQSGVPRAGYVDLRFDRQVVVTPGKDFLAQAETVH